MFLPKRKSTRIPGFDYGANYYYFVTICTYEKRCIFGRPEQLNKYGSIAEDCIRNISKIYPQVIIEKYVIMPNHVHAIVILNGLETPNLTRVIGQYKMAVTKKIRELEPATEVWQRSFHDHIIRNQQSYEKIWQYIDNNPLKWEEDCFFCKTDIMG